MKSQKNPRKSSSSRAGVVFPVARIKNRLSRQCRVARISPGSAVYLAGVMDYLIAEVVELSGNCARDMKRTRIQPRHIMLSITGDEDLLGLCKKVSIPGSGVSPYINKFLLPKEKKKKEKETTNPVIESITIKMKNVDKTEKKTNKMVDYLKLKKQKEETKVKEKKEIKRVETLVESSSESESESESDEKQDDDEHKDEDEQGLSSSDSEPEEPEDEENKSPSKSPPKNKKDKQEKNDMETDEEPVVMF